MQRWILVVAVLASVEVGCKSTECAEGTIERDGDCVPADVVADPASCGPFTEANGDQCVPMFPPTECDPSTSTPEIDPDTGVTTCVGIAGGGGCTAPLACPAPADGKQTLCGRMYTLEDGEIFQAENATGARCTYMPPAASGPCAVGIRAYDAIAFATNPGTAMPRPTEDFYMDDCGRFRLTNVDNPPPPGFMGLGIDDANPASQGPAGVTNVVGIASAITTNGTSINNLEGYIVPVSTTTKWQTTGGPGIAMGYYVPIFRQRRTGFLTQAGVTVYKALGGGMPVTANDYYFKATDVTRETIDNTTPQNSTGANGTALVSGATLADMAYLGVGGLPPECTYPPAPGVTLPGIVFISIFRPTDRPSMTCPR
jgi:hypothetical protein